MVVAADEESEWSGEESYEVAMVAGCVLHL